MSGYTKQEDTQLVRRKKKNLLQLGFVYGFQEFCMLWVMFNCRHTFGFSGEQGKLAQLACIDSQTIVYAIGCGLHRYRCMLHTIMNPAHFTMIYMLIIIQVERERERERESLFDYYLQAWLCHSW